MVKKFIVGFAFLVPLILQAQLTINVQLPQAGLVQKDQLWNLVLVNNSNTTYDANIFLDLQDANTGQSILSAGTRMITLSKGVKLLNAQEIHPIQYNIGVGGFSGNYLPLGSYIACYTVSRNVNKQAETLTNECVRLNIVPLSPPLLNSPADKSVLKTSAPQFTWTPPSPLNMFDNLNYELSISEVLPGQAPVEAMRHNTPVYIKTNAKLSFENYPATYSKLERGKTYAWQVTARNGLNSIASTEVWSFGIEQDSAKVQIDAVSYILLKPSGSESGINYIPDNKLHVKYYCFDKEHEGVIRFLSLNGKLIQEKKQKLFYGDNFLSYELNNKYKEQQTYIVEISDSQNQKYTALFSIN